MDTHDEDDEDDSGDEEDDSEESLCSSFDQRELGGSSLQTDSYYTNALENISHHLPGYASITRTSATEVVPDTRIVRKDNILK